MQSGFGLWIRIIDWSTSIAVLSVKLENGPAPRLLELNSKAFIFSLDTIMSSSQEGWVIAQKSNMWKCKPVLTYRSNHIQALQSVWWNQVCMLCFSASVNMVMVDNIGSLKEANHRDRERERWVAVLGNCSCGDVRARFKLVWLRGRCDWLKMVLISSQGWCKACRARLNASNPDCFTENNPGTAASAPGSCAGAAFKETAGPNVSKRFLVFTLSVHSSAQTAPEPDLVTCFRLMWEDERWGKKKNTYSWRSSILTSVGYSHFSHFPRENSPESPQNRKWNS